MASGAFDLSIGFDASGFIEAIRRFQESLDAELLSQMADAGPKFFDDYCPVHGDFQTTKLGAPCVKCKLDGRIVRALVSIPRAVHLRKERPNETRDRAGRGSRDPSTGL